tara:strand:+ start:1404 stop:1856 length:453 start_codon:yes stop_codon:yes gene_type:complete
MKRGKKRRFILPLVTIFLPSLLFAPKANAGGFGAEIFCTMRDGGNEHESSWEAAYTYIKKQKGGLFKVSPKQAAAQIVETVVREQEKFSYCVKYLEKLNPNRKLERDLKKESERKDKEEAEKAAKRERLQKELEETDPDYSKESFDRYSY